MPRHSKRHTHKVAIVVQRYGEEIVGGAEAHARELAESLVHKLAWQVDVLTTCAKDYRTWKNEYSEESTVLNGVRVLRFRSLFGRSPLFAMYNRFATPVLLKLENIPILRPLLRIFEWLWVFLQGPVNVRLARYLKRNENTYERFFFFTYLYMPTLWGISTVGKKAVLIPTAHDEAPFYFSVYKKMLNKVPVILANSPAEKKLLAEHIRDPSKIRIAGLGFSPTLRSVSPKEGKPYILYLGRLSRGKNVDVLISNFLNYIHIKNSKIELVLAGKLEAGFEVPHHPQIRCLGFVSGEEKNSLIYNARCIVNPSPLESLSLLVLEGIVRERPVLVNKHCPVLKDYVDACKSVLGYGDEEEFIANLARILRRDWSSSLHYKKLSDAKKWAEEQYSWDKILREYELCLQ